MQFVKLTYSEKFKNLLASIANVTAAEFLLKMNNCSFMLDFYHVDMVENTDRVVITLCDRDKKIELKIGKFLTKVASDLGTPTHILNIEYFVNIYKSFSAFDEISANFELVSGKDIKKYYHISAYANSTGTMGNSCMRYNSCQHYLGLYSKNTETVNLLILKQGHKIIGRALVWKDMKLKYQDDNDNTHRGVITFMDRIYAKEDYIVHLFIKYAKLKGWAYKTSQNSNPQQSIILDNKELDDYKIFKYLPNIDYDFYPYLDTLCYFKTDNGFISNKSFINSVRLQYTNGGYSSEYLSEYNPITPSTEDPEFLESQKQLAIENEIRKNNKKLQESI